MCDQLALSNVTSNNVNILVAIIAKLYIPKFLKNDVSVIIVASYFVWV